jgi:hypothetical protein
VRAEPFARRLISALAARPRSTTVSTPIGVATRWAAALAARPVVVSGRPAGEGNRYGETMQASSVDLAAKVDTAWDDFYRTLADALGTLSPGDEVELRFDPGTAGAGTGVYEVRVRAEADGSLTGLASGNATLATEYRLDRAGIAGMIVAGWQPPGVLAGSGDLFGVRLPPGEHGKVARLVVRTMRQMFRAPHPAYLEYVVHDPTDVSLPPARPVSDQPHRRVAHRGDAPLAERAAAVVAELLRIHPDQLQVDADGDIGIRAGSAMVFVRVRENPPLVDVFSPVLTKIPQNEKLYAKLSELTNRLPIGRLYWADDTVWASVPVFGRDFQPSHLMLAIEVMTGLADELDDRLSMEFGGRRFFDSDSAQSYPQRMDPAAGLS